MGERSVELAACDDSLAAGAWRALGALAVCKTKLIASDATAAPPISTAPTRHRRRRCRLQARRRRRPRRAHLHAVHSRGGLVHRERSEPGAGDAAGGAGGCTPAYVGSPVQVCCAAASARQVPQSFADLTVAYTCRLRALPPSSTWTKWWCWMIRRTRRRAACRRRRRCLRACCSSWRPRSTSKSELEAPRPAGPHAKGPLSTLVRSAVALRTPTPTVLRSSTPPGHPPPPPAGPSSPCTPTSNTRACCPRWTPPTTFAPPSGGPSGRGWSGAAPPERGPGWMWGLTGTRTSRR